MTVERISQLPAEVLRTSTATNLRTSQLATEVVRRNGAVSLRVSQVPVEVLRENAPDAVVVRRPVNYIS